MVNIKQQHGWKNTNVCIQYLTYRQFWTEVLIVIYESKKKNSIWDEYKY